MKEIRLGIVCPMANERDSCEAFISEVLSECRPYGFRSVSFYSILDRASTDGTYGIIEKLSGTLPELVLIYAPENRCVVDAYLRGYREALAGGCDWILEIDAGFSHQPSDLHRFFDTMRQGYDCVFGSRFCSGGDYVDSPMTRYLLSRGGTALANLLLGTGLKDMTSGFEIFSRDALESILARGITSRGPFFQTEIKFHARTLRTTEVPIQYRSTGQTAKLKYVLDSFACLWRLFRGRIADA